ncbi:ECF transporter S component [Feifania hominis]|uniref:Riboflavin transporter n=1 Tax=Feifania hominis TaxID=2763660 RepID=A0A926DCT9_9FIRM|nr:ECF transporter S component [Feifania hominis]MBC8535464.1 ECF transporter S component [Feifania hominis]
MDQKINRLVRLALLAAVSVVLMYLVRIPWPAAPFLEYDPADVSIMIGTFFYGPVAGLALTVVVSAIQALTVSAASQWYGFVMHVIATGTLVLVTSFVLRRGGMKNRMAWALVIGTLSMAAVMVPANLLLTPLYMQVPSEAVVELLLPAILPFNLVKAGINCVVAWLVYGGVSRVIKAR